MEDKVDQEFEQSFNRLWLLTQHSRHLDLFFCDLVGSGAVLFMHHLLDEFVYLDVLLEIIVLRMHQLFVAVRELLNIRLGELSLELVYFSHLSVISSL